ncbi:MAG: DHA2 family efflux MFS transporter permease subunit [Alphaproteobacteria bacterium]
MTAAADALVVRDRTGARVVTPGYRFAVVAAALLGSTSSSLSATVVNVAVPDIMGTFGVGQDQAQWMATAFFAAMTVGMLLTDWFVRAFGQRAIYIASVLFFCLACVMGGLAQDFLIVVLARALQGLMAGLLLPLTMLSLFMVFPPYHRSRAMGLYGLSFTLGPGVGPWIGGIAVDAFDWRFTFFIVLPVLFISGIVAALTLPGRGERGPEKGLDWGGLVLVSIFMAATLTGLSNGQLRGWDSDFVLGLLGVGGVSLVAFVVWEALSADPIFDVRLLMRPRVAFAAMISGAFGVAMFGSLYLVPVFVQLVEGFTPTRAGLVLVPGGLALGLVFPIMGRLGDKARADLMVGVGFLIFAWTTWEMGLLDANAAFWTVALLVVVSRIGNAMVFPPLTANVLATLPPEKIGNANGILNFMRQGCGAFGINLLAIFLEQRSAFYASAIASTQTERNFVADDLMARLGGLFETHGFDEMGQGAAATWYLGRVLSHQATALAFRDTFFAYTGVAIVGALLALALRPNRRR